MIFEVMCCGCVPAVQFLPIPAASALSTCPITAQQLAATGHTQGNHGIFSGDAVSWATLRFSAERARWVASERWHLNQEARLLKDGTYELKVPYSDDRELIMDIMKYGGDCTVISPQALVKRVAAELERARNRYPK